MRKTFGLSAMFVLAVALLSSCTSQKNLIYLQGSEDMNGDILHTYSGDEKDGRLPSFEETRAEMRCS